MHTHAHTHASSCTTHHAFTLRDVLCRVQGPAATQGSLQLVTLCRCAPYWPYPLRSRPSPNVELQRHIYLALRPKVLLVTRSVCSPGRSFGCACVLVPKLRPQAAPNHKLHRTTSCTEPQAAPNLHTSTTSCDHKLRPQAATTSLVLVCTQHSQCSRLPE